MGNGALQKATEKYSGEGEKVNLTKKGLRNIPKQTLISFAATAKMVLLQDNELFKDKENTLVELRNFTKLQHLNLNNNKLTKFPLELCALSLTHLDLGKNKISKLPNEFAVFKDHLKHLCVSENNIDNQSLEMIVDLPALTSLDLVNNKLNESNFSKLRFKATNLEILDVSANTFTIIPANFYEITSLQSLSFSSNQVYSLRIFLLTFQSFEQSGLKSVFLTH